MGRTFLKTKNEKIAMTGMLFAAGILLPFAASHGLGISGNVLLPMHIPVFLCGFLCGPLYGALCGVLLPVINSVLTGMPVLYPMVPIMSGELFAYGMVSGLLYGKTRLGKMRFGVYPALLGAMLCGRAVYGLVFQVLLFLGGAMKALTVWSAIITGLPGIIIQFLLIPPVILFFRQGHKKGETNAVRSAINLISEGTVSCVIIKENMIVRTGHGQGIGPVIRLYEDGALKDALAVDKIVGKAAAMIFTLGGVKACYGLTISAAALQWLREHGVYTEYEKCVEAIINRAGDGICPMERAVQEIEDEKEALAAVKKKMEELKNAERERQEVL